jgi:hypothetical protein
MSEVWSPERAREWYSERGPIRGTNFHPSTAGNWIEMWQSETWDEVTIARELKLAASMGLNSIRTFIPFVVWEHEAEGLKKRIDRLLELATVEGLTIMPSLFDDCNYNSNPPHLGIQETAPGVFVSGWKASPGDAIVSDPSRWPALRNYVTDIVGTFREDPRVLLWDLYNEPKPSRSSFELVRAAFGWAREANPVQPLSSGPFVELDHLTALVGETDGFFAGWEDAREILPLLNETMLDLSDVVTFHCYRDAVALRDLIARLAERGRPMLCTEWMAREIGTLPHTHLPVFAACDPPIGWYVWGLVTGRMQTHINPFGNPNGPYTGLWRHDFFWPDGTPYDERELALIRDAAAPPAG